MRLPRIARWFMLALLVCFIPASSYAGIFISVNFGPPVLPVYVQPPCPSPDLIWTPGYWAYGGEGYYWVPGAWVPAPFVGGLWTPGYWGWGGGMYMFHPGYWGYHVGYYGGVNYGGGYLGIGFAGGEWRGGHMAYNTAVVNVNRTYIHTTFEDRTVINTHIVNNPNHVAYSGGPGGVQHNATSEEMAAAHESHTPPTTFQAQHIQAAQSNHASYAKVNGGHPSTLAVARPLPVESHPAPPHTANVNARTGMQTGGAPAGRTTTAPTATHTQPTYQNHATTAPQYHSTAPTQNRATTTPQYRPQSTPQSRPAPAPQYHPQSTPQSRPAPAPQYHPQAAPQNHAEPAPRSEGKPRPEQRPKR